MMIHTLSTIDPTETLAIVFQVNSKGAVVSNETLIDLAEKGSFNSSLVKFDEAMRQTIEMASNAYKNEDGIVGVPTGLSDLDGRLGGLHKSDLLIEAAISTARR